MDYSSPPNIFSSRFIINLYLYYFTVFGDQFQVLICELLDSSYKFQDISFQILCRQLIVIVMHCSIHSSHSRLVISSNWVRSCVSLNPPSFSLKAIIFWARGSLICKMLVSSSWDAELIFIVLSSGF